MIKHNPELCTNCFYMHVLHTTTHLNIPYSLKTTQLLFQTIVYFRKKKKFFLMKYKLTPHKYHAIIFRYVS